MIRQYVKENPEKEFYRENCFIEQEYPPTATMLDEICSDPPIYISTIDGHSAWLHTKTMELFGITKEMAKTFGPNMIPVDKEGNPTGFLSEKPAIDLMKRIPINQEDRKKCLFAWQDFCFSLGYTAVYEAGVNLDNQDGADFYQEAAKDPELKLRTYAGYCISEESENLEKDVLEILSLQKQYNSERFQIIGAKLFTDGIVEGHTALLLEDYTDDPGYKDVGRFCDVDKLAVVYETAAAYGLSVHTHCIGDGATRVNLDAISKVVEKTGKKDHRFALAHLQLVDEEDIPRFSELGATAVTAPLWWPKEPGYLEKEESYLGMERAESVYPIKSIIQQGARTAFHSDYPVSTNTSIPHTLYTAVTRMSKELGEASRRGKAEVLTRKEALSAMTKDVACLWKEEDRMGSIEVGKLANFSIFDKDFLSDPMEEVYAARLVATIIDGEVVFAV